MQRRGTSPASDPQVIAPLTPTAAVEITLSLRRWLAKGDSGRGRVGQLADVAPREAAVSR
jgi:hypothetical protein